MRVSSGVPGFDDLVHGGIPAGTVVIVQGPAGREKDAFLLQFVAEGLRSGGSALVVLSSATPAKYLQELREAGVDADRAVAEERLKLVDWFTYRENPVQDVERNGAVFRASIDLANVGIAISRAIATLPPQGERRAALEVLSPALNAYDATSIHAFAEATKAKLERSAFTAMFVLDKELHDERTMSSIHELFDGVVDIERMREGDAIVRKIAVLSLRGTAAESKYVPMELSTDGVLRVSTASIRERTLPQADSNLADSVTRLLADVDQRLRDNPRDADALFVKAAGLARGKDLAGALGALEALANLDETYPGLWILKTMIHARRGEVAKAEESFARRLEIEREQVRRFLEGPLSAPPSSPPSSQPPSSSCPSCGAPRGDHDEACVSCGASFAGEEQSSAPPSTQLPGPTTEIRQPAPTLRRPEPKVPPLVRPPVPRAGAEQVRPEPRALHAPTAPGSSTDSMPPEPSARETPRGRVRAGGLANTTLGRTNGLARGPRGRTNGLVNGTRGRTNGLTNGSGLTNGLGTARPKQQPVRTRWEVYAIPVITITLLLIPMLLTDTSSRHHGIVVDGESSDWAPARLVSQGSSASTNPNVDIIRAGVVGDETDLSFLIEVRGGALAGGGATPTTDRFHIFVDMDKNPATGYTVDSLGAERLLDVSGQGGTVQEASLYTWDGTMGPEDWRGWQRSGSVRAAAAQGRLEIQTDWSSIEAEPAPVAAVIHTRAFDATIDTSDGVFDSAGGSLLLVQEPVVADVLFGPTTAPLLQLDAIAYGGDATLSGLSVRLTGVANLTAVAAVRLADAGGTTIDERVAPTGQVDFQFASRTIRSSAPERFSIVADLLPSDGGTIGAIVADASDVGASVPVSLRRTPSAQDVGYLSVVPPSPRVDGGFDEWIGSSLSDAQGDVGASEIDLTTFDAQFAANTSFFYAAVDGRMLSGTWVPEGNRVVYVRGNPDSDGDNVPDVVDPFPFDFNNDMVPDADTGGDVDGDGVLDYGQAGGTDWWLNTTIPQSFPAPYAGRTVNAFIGPWEPPFRTRDDVVRVFVDADNSSATGYAIANLGADRLIEVSGTDGRLGSAEYFGFGGSNPGQWSWIPRSPVAAALAFNRMEFSVAENFALGDTRIFIEARAPLGATDGLEGTRGLGTARWSDLREFPAGSSPSSPPAPNNLGGLALDTRGSLGPQPLDIGGNQKWYLRDTNEPSENICTNNYVASTTQGPPPVTSTTLSTGQDICWYAEATSGTTIPAGSWESLLDVTTMGGGVIGYDVAGTGWGSGTTVDITGPNVGSGPDRILLVGIGQGNSAVTLTSVTWDQGGTNQAMTRITGVSQNTDTRVELWKLVSPTSGVKTLRIISPSSVGMAVGIVAYYGVDQTTPNDTPATATGAAGTSPSVTVSSSSGDLVVDAVSSRNDLSNKSPGPGQTERYERSGGDEIVFGSEEAGASSVTMSWTGTFSEWAQIGVSLNPSSWAVEYDVYLDIWDKPSNTVKTPIGSCLNVVTTGDDVRCLVSGVAQQILDSNDVVRVRVAHSSPTGTVQIDYDDSDTTGDSRITIPTSIPEFGDVALPVFSAVLLPIVWRRWPRKPKAVRQEAKT